jgi:peptide/nickel transport system permease protein
MTGVTWRDWLLTETPASRRQAAWGRRYRMWCDFSASPVAMTGLILAILLFVLALSAPLLVTHDPSVQDLAHRLAKPSAAHWFGTDELGRDVYSRVLHGGRITLGMVVAVVIVVAPLGLAVGCAAGYAGGWADRVLMRVTDIFLAFPRLILALAFVAAIRPGVASTVAAIALTAWPPYARVARAETLTFRNADFIGAVRLTGASPFRIILRHVAPLCLSSLIVRVTLDMSSIILTAAALGFLGMGVQPPLPEWGAMIATARRFILEQWGCPRSPASPSSWLRWRSTYWGTVCATCWTPSSGKRVSPCLLPGWLQSSDDWDTRQSRSSDDWDTRQPRSVRQEKGGGSGPRSRNRHSAIAVALCRDQNDGANGQRVAEPGFGLHLPRSAPPGGSAADPRAPPRLGPVLRLAETRFLSHRRLFRRPGPDGARARRKAARLHQHLPPPRRQGRQRRGR